MTSSEHTQKQRERLRSGMMLNVERTSAPSASLKLQSETSFALCVSYEVLSEITEGERAQKQDALECEHFFAENVLSSLIEPALRELSGWFVGGGDHGGAERVKSGWIDESVIVCEPEPECLTFRVTLSELQSNGLRHVRIEANTLLQVWRDGDFHIILMFSCSTLCFHMAWN